MPPQAGRQWRPPLPRCLSSWFHLPTLGCPLLLFWQDEIAQIVDGIWSLQYMAAGPICGSAGPLSQFRRFVPEGGAPGPAAPGAQPLTCQPFTHAVLFRYANAVARERFEAQPRVVLMLGGTGAPAGTGTPRPMLDWDCCWA